ncbi:unnamed protein product [Clonostachys byssicola]|uniref:Multifunctional fusion protein n=1 Tax=Clonostachys byssicola TaxID=160290 RepID=A0A9N9YA90_9HYPO|nr:unnamed protein product [Clonostachys byssicola]
MQSRAFLRRGKRISTGGFKRPTLPVARFSTIAPPPFENAPPKHYAKGSPERDELSKTLHQMKESFPAKIPITVSGKIINSDTTSKQINPSNHAQVVAEYASASTADVNAAIDAALKAKLIWEAMSFDDRAAIFLRAAELVSTKYRSEMVAAVMLGQSKNIWQGEIDGALETIDFIRQYVAEAGKLFQQQPKIHDKTSWNKLEYRPLEGFVYAIAPFNFTGLFSTLVAPVSLLGNVVLWKPSDYALHSSWLLYKIILEAGLPKDVIQFVPGNPQVVTDAVLARPEFGALSFIGSTEVYRELIGKIGQATAQGRYNSYPRIIGETGGKNFHLVHGSADVKNAVLNTIRAGFEYQGQKCSAASRVYVAESVWPQFKEILVSELSKIKTGSPDDYRNLVNAVIHERAFDRLNDVITAAKSDPELELVAGGQASKAEGFYIHPTVYRSTNPDHDIMRRELFGPLLAVYVYPDAEFSKTLESIDKSQFALTGSVFVTDPLASREAQDKLMHAAGNLYLNTKCTGSAVGQQPFGGSRQSGSNDKSGTVAFLTRYVSVRTVKEAFDTLDDVHYPSNEA